MPIDLDEAPAGARRSSECPEVLDVHTGELLPYRIYEDVGRYQAKTIGSPSPFKRLTSLVQRDRFMANIDKRKLVTVDGTRRLFDVCAGDARLHDRKPAMSRSQFKKLQQLTGVVDYLNIGYRSPQKLSEALGTNPRVLHRYLQPIAPYVLIEGAAQGLRKGTLRITIHPIMVFRAFSQGHAALQMRAITDWNQTLIRLQGYSS